MLSNNIRENFSFFLLFWINKQQIIFLVLSKQTNNIYFVVMLNEKKIYEMENVVLVIVFTGFIFPRDVF